MVIIVGGEVGVRETSGQLEEFSELWSEACPCQSQGSRGG